MGKSKQDLSLYTTDPLGDFMTKKSKIYMSILAKSRAWHRNENMASQCCAVQQAWIMQHKKFRSRVRYEVDWSFIISPSELAFVPDYWDWVGQASPSTTNLDFGPHTAQPTAADGTLKSRFPAQGTTVPCGIWSGCGVRVWAQDDACHGSVFAPLLLQLPTKYLASQ